MIDANEFGEEQDVLVETGLDSDHDELSGHPYFREMTAFALLTPEEEAGYSCTIQENFRAIIDLVLQDRSGSRDVAKAKALVRQWQEKDKEIRPRQSYLRVLVNGVFIASRLQPENDAVQELQSAVHWHRTQIDTARDIMIQSNLRLVAKIASNYRNMGLPLDDLIQEGNIGLMRAVMRFDYRLGNRLSSYAVWWIRQAIGNALVQKTRTIQVPFNVSLLANRYSKALNELRHRLDQEPTAEEVARQGRLTMDEIRAVAEVPAEPLPLDMPVSEDGELTLGNLLENTAETTFDLLAEEELREELHSWLQVLNARDRRVIVARFGLDRVGEKTLKEVGSEMKLSRERVRQLEQSSLQQLRQSMYFVVMK